MGPSDTKRDPETSTRTRRPTFTAGTGLVQSGGVSASDTEANHRCGGDGLERKRPQTPARTHCALAASDQSSSGDQWRIGRLVSASDVRSSAARSPGWALTARSQNQVSVSLNFDLRPDALDVLEEDLARLLRLSPEIRASRRCATWFIDSFGSVPDSSAAMKARRS